MFNVDKTKGNIFKHKNYITINLIITLYNKKFEIVKQPKYLNIVLSKNNEIEIDIVNSKI